MLRTDDARAGPYERLQVDLIVFVDVLPAVSVARMVTVNVAVLALPRLTTRVLRLTLTLIEG